MSEDIKNNIEIEVVTDDENDLEISPVYDHLNLDKVRDNENKKKNIIIPEVKKDEKKSN